MTKKDPNTNEPKWRGITLRRRSITWATGGKDAHGRTPPQLSVADARRLLQAIAGGMDPRELADTHGISGISIDYRKRLIDQRGRRGKKAQWSLSVFIDLNPCMDASRFRGPLGGLPPEAFKGF